MFRHVLLLGGLGGVIVSLLLWWHYPDDPGDVNLIIHHGHDIYRQEADTGRTMLAGQLPAQDDLKGVSFITERPSPNGQWLLITYTAQPDRAYVIDLISGTLAHTVDFELHDSIDYFGTWSPDSRHVGWIVRDGSLGGNFVLVLNVISGHLQWYPLPLELFPAGRWLDNRTVEIWSSSKFGSYSIDIYAGRMVFKPDVPFEAVADCCHKPFLFDRGIYFGSDEERRLELDVNASEIVTSADSKDVAYLTVDNANSHVFVFDTVTGKNKKVTTEPLPLSEDCLMVVNLCRTLRAWSPDTRWILLSLDGYSYVLNVHTGQLRPVFEDRAFVTWTYISLANDRGHFSRLMGLNLIIFLAALWRVARAES